MKIWIPCIGDAIRLDGPWTFKLHDERRNDKFRVAMGLSRPSKSYSNPLPPEDVVIPAGAELVIDRIYIRQDADDFASVSFVVKDHPDPGIVSNRFWAKLDDVNRIEATFISSDNPIGFAASSYRTQKQAQVDPSVLAMAAQRKAAKAEMESIREQLAITLRTALWNSGDALIKAHMLKIVSNAYEKNAFTPSVSWSGSLCKSNRQAWEEDELKIMCHADKPYCHKSRKGPDGTQVRDFFFRGLFDPKDGGFRVTSKDGTIVTVIPI